MPTKGDELPRNGPGPRAIFSLQSHQWFSTINTDTTVKVTSSAVYGNGSRTCNRENEIVSVIAVLCGIDRVPVNLSDAPFLHLVGGQNFLTPCIWNGLQQADKTAVHARHTTVKFNDSSNWYESCVDAKTCYKALLHASSCSIVICPLTCQGITLVTVTLISYDNFIQEFQEVITSPRTGYRL